MINKLKTKAYNFLRWSEKYTKTDMIYLTKGGFWLGFGNIISSFSGFLLAIAFANLLPKETFGIYKYVLSIASILSIATLSGMNTAIVRAIAKGYDGTYAEALQTKIRWGMWGGLAGLFISLYYYLNGNIELTISFLIVSLFTPFMDSLNLYSAYLNGKKDFKSISNYGMSIKILSSLSIFILLLFTSNLLILLFVYFLSNTLLRLLFTILTAKKHKTDTIKKDNETISYGKHLSLVNAVNTGATQIDSILIFQFLGVVELAIYSFAMVVPEQIKSFLKNINILILPKFSENKHNITKKDLNKKILIFTAILTPFLAISILVLPFVFKIFFSNYTESVFYGQLLILSMIVFPIGSIGVSYLNAMKKQKELYQYNLFSSITLIGFLLLGVNFGLIGVVSAKILQRLAISTMLIFLTYNTTD